MSHILMGMEIQMSSMRPPPCSSQRNIDIRKRHMRKEENRRPSKNDFRANQYPNTYISKRLKFDKVTDRVHSERTQTELVFRIPQ